MSRRPIRRTASLILLMLLLPVAAADTIQMFTNGSDSVSFGTQTDIRTDSGLLYDGDSVKISIPAAHSIVQASLNISVEPSVSSGSIVYPAPGTANPWEDYADIYASFVGDGSDTALSDETKGSQMTVTDPYLALFSEGNGSDFEGDDGGFKSTTNTSELKDGSDFHLNSTSDFRKADGTPSMEKYIGGFQVNGYAFGPIADGCLGGDSNTCWGTNFDDYFYLDDGKTNEWEYLFESPIYEYANSNPVLTFKSWHGLAEVANGPIDCAYVQVAAANTLEEFDEDRIQWTAMTLNGSTPTNSEIWTSTQQDYVSNNDCDGPGAPENPEGAPSLGDKVLTGRSQAGSGGGTGWADVKYNLEENGIYSSYVKFRFVMEYNKPSGMLENQSLPGWYVDNVQFGDKKVNGAVALSPAVSTSQSTASAGFGVAFVDIYEPVAGDVSISVVDTYTREVITDDAGVELKDLRPPIIELWDINSSKHPSIRLAIEMSSGPNNLRTPYLKSYHIGHSLVVNSAQKDFITYDENTFVKDGTIASERWKPTNGSWLRYAPKIPVHGLESAALGDRFSHPVIGIDPSVIHDCPSPPWVNLSTGNNTSVSLSLDQINQLPNQTHTLDFNITFPNMSADCAVESFTFDLQFGLYPEGLAVDIGGDGDTDWSMMDPAFGAFGRQQMFYLTTTMDGVSRGSLLRNITVASGGATAGQGVGGHFILPAGAVIDESVIGVLANEVGNFSLWLATKTSAGPVVEEHVTDYRYEWGPSHPSLDTHMSGFSRALHNLSTHPDVAASRVDDNGDTWNEYYFIIRNATDAQAGSTEVQLGEMSVRYFWTTAITDTRSNLIRELNQGASITPPSGQNTEIPLLVYTRTAGGASFDDLTVVTVEGLDSIWGFRSFNTGLYPTGEIYSQETTHLSAVADSSISGARLVFESETGDAAIKYDVQTNTFTEEDPLDLIILDSSSSATSLGAGQLKVTWKFRVNTNWEDTAVVQFYGSTIVDTNLGARYEGKPVGYTFDPEGGNAVENDAYFSQFEIHNTAGVRQTDFTEVRTTPELTLSGQVRLENLDISPDPKLYNLSLERYVPSDSSYTVADVCMPDVPTSTCTVTHGNFTWNLTLASSEEAVYRLRIDDYSGGDLLDVPAEITPDPQLLPQDNSSVYFKVNISNVQSSPTITDLSYRFGSAGTGFYWPFLPLGGSTWLSPNREGAGTPQMINATVRDIKQTLGAVTMHYWLSGIDDDNQDGQAQESEYTEVPMTRIGSVSDTIKYFHAELDDRPSDPGGTTVISVYFTGVDEFGNPLTSEADIIENAGGPGVTNDLLTYKAMNAARPSADSFSLYDVYGNQMLDDPATLFAGNTYKLCVDGSDSNGWVDVKTIEIDLMNTSKGDQPLSIADYKIIYDPENVTFSRPDAGEVSVYDPDRYVVDGVETSIIELVSPMNITRPDGVAYLQDPFEESFRACVSIQLSWNIPGNIVNKSTEFDPVVSVIDRFGFSSVKSSGLQSFMYSDGLVLTDLQIIEHNDVDEIDVRDTWIYTSTQLNISGRYVYLDGLGEETDALPEAPLTLGLYREGADRPADRPWDAALPEIQCWTFTGGVFDVTFQAPIRTQQYVYHVDLVEDDQDRCEDSQQPPALDIRDFTPAGERLFNLYTDNDAPSLSVNDQGQSIFNVNGLTRSDPSTIPISRIECFEYSVFIFDSEHPGPDALPDSTPYLLKWVYYDPETKDFWSEAKETSSQPKVFSESLKEFQITTNSYKFESKAEGGTCIDLWPLNRAVPSTVTDVQIRMWIEGEDSAGNELAGGGSYQTPLIEMFVESLEARFEIILGSVPAIEGGETNTVSVDESFTVYFQFDNIGTVAGSFDYTLYLVDEDQLIPITSSTSPELAPDASDYGAFSILVPGQPLERSQLRLRLVDGDSGEKMWESQNPFNIVPKEVTSTLGLGSVEEAGDIIVLLIVVSSTVVLLLVVVIVVLLRGRSPEYDDEDVIDDSVFAMPRYTTESQGGTYGSGDAYAQAEQYAQQEYGYDPRYAQQDWQQQQQQQQQQQNWQQQQQPQEGWQQQQQPQQGWQQQQQPQQGHAPPQQGYGQQQGGQNQGWYQQDEQY